MVCHTLKLKKLKLLFVCLRFLGIQIMLACLKRASTLFTTLAWDNIDQIEETLSGEGISHRINGIINSQICSSLFTSTISYHNMTINIIEFSHTYI